jgi:hypothetical protein
MDPVGSKCLLLLSVDVDFPTRKERVGEHHETLSVAFGLELDVLGLEHDDPGLAVRRSRAGELGTLVGIDERNVTQINALSQHTLQRLVGLCLFGATHHIGPRQRTIVSNDPGLRIFKTSGARRGRPSRRGEWWEAAAGPHCLHPQPHAREVEQASESAWIHAVQGRHTDGSTADFPL